MVYYWFAIRRLGSPKRRNNRYTYVMTVDEDGIHVGLCLGTRNRILRALKRLGFVMETSETQITFRKLWTEAQLKELSEGNPREYGQRWDEIIHKKLRESFEPPDKQKMCFP